MVDMGDDGEIANVLERRGHKRADSRSGEGEKDGLAGVNRGFAATLRV